MTVQQSSAMQTHFADPPFGSERDSFGCTVNRIAVEELFERYDALGFLYEAKRRRLERYLPLIADNWRRSMSGAHGQFIHDVVVFERPGTGAWASVSYWATTNQSVHSQHLVSTRVPEASRAVLLCAQSESFRYGHAASQNWFRPENRYPARVFGASAGVLGDAAAALHQHAYRTVPKDCLPPHSTGVQVQRCADRDSNAVNALAQTLCGAVQAAADGWADGDLELRALNERFRAVGLSRYRHVFVASIEGRAEPIGMAVAYRGPLGLNFSFLENRCELWIDRHADTGQRSAATAALTNAAAATYAEFELPLMVLTSNFGLQRTTSSPADSSTQNYSQTVWLRQGYTAWFGHVNSLYERIAGAACRHRRGLGRAAS